ncbi:MAG: hypothetical protein F6K58_17955 [Symploca sp. SIO2E9]|nr:hypothetical protein [Symploca sp. SIO2E9]
MVNKEDERNQDRIAIASLVAGLTVTLTGIVVGVIEPEIRCWLRLPSQYCSVPEQKTKPKIPQSKINESICFRDRQR